MLPMYRRRLAIGLPLILALALAACYADPSRPSDAPPTAFPTASAVSSIGQTETDWGPIWDALPGGFPIFPGASESNEIDVGPASATLVVSGATAADVSDWMARRLTEAGYAVDGGGAPLEDGSYGIEASGEGDCRMSVTVAPLGDLTAITILYGTGCPNT